MSDLLKSAAEFQSSLLARRVASRFAMEHATPEAMRDYLHEHPNADPKDHKVEKKDEKGDGEKKEKGKDKNPFVGDMKLVNKTNKAPQESLKSVKTLSRLLKQLGRAGDYKGDSQRVPELKEKVHAEHDKLVSQAEDWDKTLDDFLTKHKDVKDDHTPGRSKALENVQYYAKSLKKVITESKEVQQSKYEWHLEDSAEKLHAAILNASQMLGILVKPKD